MVKIQNDLIYKAERQRILKATRAKRFGMITVTT